MRNAARNASERDGSVDDLTVHAHMVANGYLLFVPATESDADSTAETYGLPPGVGQAQMTGVWEAVPNSCDTPTNRGASASDRSTWAAAVDTSDLSCDSQRDATTEEVLHLITMAAAFVYPELWGESYSSAAGAAIQAAKATAAGATPATGRTRPATGARGTMHTTTRRATSGASWWKESTGRASRTLAGCTRSSARRASRTSGCWQRPTPRLPADVRRGCPGNRH